MCTQFQDVASLFSSNTLSLHYRSNDATHIKNASHAQVMYHYTSLCSGSLALAVAGMREQQVFATSPLFTGLVCSHDATEVGGQLN